MTLATRPCQSPQQCLCPRTLEQLLKRPIERHDRVDRDPHEHPTPDKRGPHPTATARRGVHRERPHG